MKPDINLKNRPAIYCIRNDINNKVYVGKTKCPWRRCHQYKYDFENRRGDRINNYLVRSMEKHGFENFTFSILEFCTIENSSEKELFWMDKLNSCNRDVGYNLRRDSSSGMIVHPETSEKIRNNLRQQWADGVRDNHSEKLSQNWKNNPHRRKNQSEWFRKYKTVWEYLVYIKSDLAIVCDYQMLKEMGLDKGALTAFSKRKTDDVITKGFRVVRRRIKDD